MTNEPSARRAAKAPNAVRMTKELMKRQPEPVRRIVGASFDVFHRNPSHQRNMLGSLTGVHRAKIKVGKGCINFTKPERIPFDIV